MQVLEAALVANLLLGTAVRPSLPATPAPRRWPRPGQLLRLASAAGALAPLLALLPMG